jgi:hypothetical protein
MYAAAVSSRRLLPKSVAIFLPNPRWERKQASCLFLYRFDDARIILWHRQPVEKLIQAFRRFLPWEWASPARLIRHHAVVRFIREEPDKAGLESLIETYEADAWLMGGERCIPAKHHPLT